MVSYFFQDTKFKFNKRRVTNSWIRKVVAIENRVLGNLNIIICSDPYILDVNQKFLKHNYYTDINTFDYCEEDMISGDLFISIDTVRDNGEFYEAGFDRELFRVIIHGVLHLIGYDDHCEEDISVMRSKENQYLTLLEDLFLQK